MRRELRVLLGAVMVVVGAYAMVSVLVLNALEVTVLRVVAGAFLGVGAIAGGVALMWKKKLTYDPNRGGR